MRTAAVLGLGFILCAPAAGAQSVQEKIIKSCPVLTNVEAAAVLGSGTVFASGAEATSGSTRISLLCQFVEGERTFSVQASKTVGAKDVWETLRKLSNGTIEPAMGDYAYSNLAEGKPHFFIVKGPLTLELRIEGKGASSAELPKLREAAKKAVPRL